MNINSVYGQGCPINNNNSLNAIVQVYKKKIEMETRNVFNFTKISKEILKNEDGIPPPCYTGSSYLN